MVMLHDIESVSSHAAILRAMNRSAALRVVGSSALLFAAAMFASGGFLSIAVTDCAFTKGWVCAGDIETRLRGYVVGAAL